MRTGTGTGSTCAIAVPFIYSIAAGSVDLTMGGVKHRCNLSEAAPNHALALCHAYAALMAIEDDAGDAGVIPS